MQSTKNEPTASQASALKNPPHWSIQFLLLFVLFVGAGALGTVLARAFAPDSWLLMFLSFFMLPLAFIVGMQCWLGFAIFHALGSLIMRFIQKKPLQRPVVKGEQLIPSGSFLFFPLSLVSGTLVGLVAFFVASGLRWQALLAYVLSGALHGYISWRCAKAGFLPFPQPML